jgi:hypothetical protein
MGNGEKNPHPQKTEGGAPDRKEPCCPPKMS